MLRILPCWCPVSEEKGHVSNAEGLGNVGVARSQKTQEEERRGGVFEVYICRGISIYLQRQEASPIAHSKLLDTSDMNISDLVLHV